MFVSLSDEQRRFVETVRDLAQSEFRPRALQYMDGTFPWENMRALAQLGVLGMAVPEEYGGLGLPVFDTALVLEEIAKVCYVTAMAVLGEVGVQTKIIATYAPAPIRERPPTAGFWEGQTDEGELGQTYATVDRVLRRVELLEREEEIVRATGVDAATVRSIVGRVERFRHKRRLPPVAKLGLRTIGLDWRE